MVCVEKSIKIFFVVTIPLNVQQYSFHENWTPLVFPCVSAEAGSCCSWRPSCCPRPPWRPGASTRLCRNSPTSSTTSWWYDASSATPTASARWPSTSPWAPAHWRYPSTTRSAPGIIAEEEEHSSAIQPSQVLQLVQVSWGMKSRGTGGLQIFLLFVKIWHIRCLIFLRISWRVRSGWRWMMPRFSKCWI